MSQVLKFDLSPQDIQVKKILNKEFLELDIFAISDIYPNRNKSAFTLESLTKSKQTCYNKPILGCFNTIKNDFEQHNGQDAFDKDLQQDYWDTTSGHSEKILGLIRESDKVDIVESDGLHWLKISCALWTYYSYRQVKKLLKSPTKKVSVEILVKQSHFDEDGIQVIDDFILTGITILGDKITEGIPGAHLSILDLLKDRKFNASAQKLSFAYNKREDMITDADTQDISPREFALLNNLILEGYTMTFHEKLEFLQTAMKSAYADQHDMYIMDFSEDEIILKDLTDGKVYKMAYFISEEGVQFAYDEKVEQIELFRDMPTLFVEIDGEEKDIDQLLAMFNEQKAQIDLLTVKAEEDVEGDAMEMAAEEPVVETTEEPVVETTEEPVVETIEEPVTFESEDCEDHDEEPAEDEKECDVTDKECDMTEKECDVTEKECDMTDKECDMTSESDESCDGSCEKECDATDVPEYAGDDQDVDTEEVDSEEDTDSEPEAEEECTLATCEETEEDSTDDVEVTDKVDECTFQFVDINGEQCDITKVFEMYTELKSAITEKEEALDSLTAQFNDLKAESDSTSAAFEALKEQVAQAEAEKLCASGIALAEEEEDLDKDDKDQIITNCKNGVYASIEEVESDIAKALYNKKKNNRAKNFKSNIAIQKPAATQQVSVFARLKENVN